MRRGFKTEAREIAVEVRGELGLGPLEALDPWKLADHLEIPVWTVSSFRASVPAAVEHLLTDDPGAFSAVLAFAGLRRVIIHNDAHVLRRQRADVSHELAHALLLHRPHTADGTGRLEFDADQESEARWLGAVMLVSDEFCLDSARRSLSLCDAANVMGVSEQLMRWRMNTSAAKRRVRRVRTANH